MARISKYFTLEELTHSEIAARKGIDNTPDAYIISNLERTAKEADKVRELLGHPVLVSSGFRCQKLNAAVGSKPTSSHASGMAIDITCPWFGSPREVFYALKKSGLKFDQIILEFPDSSNGGWVHIGYSPRMRGEFLVFNGKQYIIA